MEPCTSTSARDPARGARGRCSASPPPAPSRAARARRAPGGRRSAARRAASRAACRRSPTLSPGRRGRRRWSRTRAGRTGPRSRRRAEVRDSGLGAHTGAGQHDARLPATDERGKALDGHAAIVELREMEGFSSRRGCACASRTPTPRDRAQLGVRRLVRGCAVEYLRAYARGYQALRETGTEALVLESFCRYRVPAGSTTRSTSTPAVSTCAAPASATSTRSCATTAS